MLCRLTISKYPKGFGIFGILSMVLFRIPLSFNKNISFYKLMGCGRNGTFDTHPDWNQWAMLTVFNKATTNTEETALLKEVKLPLFIRHYLKLFRCNSTEYILLPIEGHGTWDKKKLFWHITGNK